MQLIGRLLAALPLLGFIPAALSAAPWEIRLDLIGLGNQCASIQKIADGTNTGNSARSVEMVMTDIVLLHQRVREASARASETEPIKDVEDARMIAEAYKTYFSDKFVAMASSLNKAHGFYGVDYQKRIAFMLYRFSETLQSYDKSLCKLVHEAAGDSLGKRAVEVRKVLDNTIEVYGGVDERYRREKPSLIERLLRARSRLGGGVQREH